MELRDSNRENRDCKLEPGLHNRIHHTEDLQVELVIICKVI